MEFVTLFISHIIFSLLKFILIISGFKKKCCHIEGNSFNYDMVIKDLAF